MDKGGDMGGPAANNSSDFVRKLYKMLEDPSYEHIVRWGENGDSFVVLENEKFTKMILPKHFKHSNFASFVRQLNKYDFHKVRQNNEDNTPSPYGANAWEFKHPEFQANKKDSLDNIRRKAPAPRKPTQTLEETYPSQQMDMVNSQLMATQAQLQHLSERYHDLAQGHVVLLQQVVQLQKFVKNHDGVMHRVMGFLHSVDAQRRNSRIGGPFGANGMGSGDPSMNDGIIDDHPASPLQQASELLDEFSAENLPNKELEQMTHDYNLRNDYSATPDNTNTSLPPHSESSSAHLGYTIGNDLDSLVYPVGHTNGIDPVNSEHINNIPYSLPANGMMPVDTMPEMLPESSSLISRKKSSIESVWGMTKPRILLVEDDKVCARIGSKFLQAFECGVETARDGLEAVTKINGQSQFDLIFMDIIMPHLDGVSATVCIREARPQIPIIAMTSNIRADDIDMYFRYGMNDVLPKPFTREGMLKALEKHLPQFKKNAQYTPQPAQMSHPGGFVTPTTTHPPLGLNMGQLSAAQSLKEETSPGKSPATASSWHSPNQISGPSPVGPSPGGYMQQSMADNRQYNMTPTHPHPQSGFPPAQNQPMGAPRPTQPHRRVMSDMAGGPPDDHPEKRQRMYPPPGGFSQ
ncbi:response regulator [Mollisia scopiformis]|uniref:Transcription factor n=1 Tax=Mollisia scopiformis TaxID=149040 RepID=A0A194WRN7_MOLSC|nr:response regulator [Mollisia scopiformis]KUJ10666.1 response regulator [Mollisia scopiformis]